MGTTGSKDGKAWKGGKARQPRFPPVKDLMADEPGVSVPAFKPKLSPKGQTIRLVGWSGIFAKRTHLLPLVQGLESRGFGTQVFSLAAHDDPKFLDQLTLEECAIQMAQELGNIARSAAGNSHFILFGHSLGAATLLGLLSALYQPEKSKWLNRFEDKIKKTFFENVITFAPYLRGVMVLAPTPPKNIRNFNFKLAWKFRRQRKAFLLEDAAFNRFLLNQHNESQQKAIVKTLVKEAPHCARRIAGAPWDFFVDANIPLQIICGEHDQLVKQSVFQKIHEQVAHSEMSTLKAGDHWLIGPAFVTTTVLLMDQFVTAVLNRLK